MSIAEKLTTVAENIPKVYEAGYANGQHDGREEGYAEGLINGRAEFYNEFWSALPEDNVDGVYLFSGDMWNDITFKPNKDIRIKAGQANGLFYNNGCTNIKKSLEACGVTLDLSKVTQANSMFSFCNSTELPALDLSNVVTLNNTFASATKLVTIEKVILNEHSTFINAFNSAINLENITIYGSIGGSGFDIHWSTKLSADSLESIIEALHDGKSGLTITLPTTAQSTYDAKYGEHSWAFLISTKPNWTVAYA